MLGMILTCSALLSFVIGLNIWQSVVVVLFCTCAYLTGRKMRYGREEI